MSELEEAYKVQKETLARLESEVSRLRAVIKSAEAKGESQGWDCCPWCQSLRDGGSNEEPHADDCEAFTPDGEVR
jgi:hypothetical protein